MRVSPALVCLSLMCVGAPVAARAQESAAASEQVVNPATAGTQEKPAAQPPASEKTHTYDMPPIDVFGKAPLAEEDRIGDYAQPRWTAHRRFSETRVYVVPKGMVEFEYWFRSDLRKHGRDADITSMYEAEFGLPGRLQLDLYAVSHKTGASGEALFDSQQVELRYAFAEWNRIPGNPTAYFEWKQESGGPDVAEAKLLFGGELASRWHWGSNLVWEHQTGGERETSNEWTTGLSYTASDTKLGIGIETQLALVNTVDEQGERTPYETEFLLGPSLQWRPMPQMHLDLAPLFGVTEHSRRAKIFVVFGYEF